jgi:hypothetical protein
MAKMFCCSVIKWGIKKLGDMGDIMFKLLNVVIFLRIIIYQFYL